MPLWKYIAIGAYLITVGACVAAWILVDSLIAPLATTGMLIVSTFVLYKPLFGAKSEPEAEPGDNSE
jgi:hypothetical protein